MLLVVGDVPIDSEVSGFNGAMFSVVGDVPVDSEAFVVTSYLEVLIESGFAYVCVRVERLRLYLCNSQKKYQIWFLFLSIKQSDLYTIEKSLFDPQLLWVV
jgi:hypothetical protein